MTATCTKVTAINSDQMDYVFDTKGTKVSLPAGEIVAEMNLPTNWHNTTEGTCNFRCQPVPNAQITLTADGETDANLIVLQISKNKNAEYP